MLLAKGGTTSWLASQSARARSGALADDALAGASNLRTAFWGLCLLELPFAFIFKFSCIISFIDNLILHGSKRWFH